MKYHPTYKTIPLARIATDPDSVHSKYSLMEDDTALRQSIREFGVMSSLVVCRAGKGRFLIVDGPRRYRIARDLKIRELDCTVLPPMNAGEREALRYHLYMTYKPLTKAERLGQLRKMRKLGITPWGDLGEKNTGRGARRAA